MPEPEQVELIDAHPRLGAPPGSVSALSFREQGYDTRGRRCRRGGRAGARRGRARAAERGVRGAVRVPLLRVRRGPAARRAAPGAGGDARRRTANAELHRALDAVVDIAADRYRTLAGAR